MTRAFGLASSASERGRRPRSDAARISPNLGLVSPSVPARRRYLSQARRSRREAFPRTRRLHGRSARPLRRGVAAMHRRQISARREHADADAAFAPNDQVGVVAGERQTLPRDGLARGRVRGGRQQQVARGVVVDGRRRLDLGRGLDAAPARLVLEAGLLRGPARGHQKRHGAFFFVPSAVPERPVSRTSRSRRRRR